MLSPRKSTFIFNHWQCIIKYCTCLECGQYGHICRSFMYNNTFEALFLTSKCTKRGFLWTQTVAAGANITAVSVRPHRGATEFSPLELILVHKIAPNCEYFTNHLMHYVLQYFYNKKWDIWNTRNNEKSDSVELIRGLKGPLTRRGSNMHFYPFQCWATKRCVKFNNK